MALPKVDAVIVGAGAGGGIVAKQLTTAGLHVVLLERGKWYTANDCRKDDLRNQRNSQLGQRLSVQTTRAIRACWWTSKGASASSNPSAPATTTTPPAWAAAPSAMAPWRGVIMEKDFRMRSTYGAVGRQHARRLARRLRGSGTLLREGGVGDRRLRRRSGNPFKGRGASPCPCRRCRQTREHEILEAGAKKTRAAPASTSPCCATPSRTTAARRACAAAGAWDSPAKWMPSAARRTPSSPRRWRPGNCELRTGVHDQGNAGGRAGPRHGRRLLRRRGPAAGAARGPGGGFGAARSSRRACC